MSCSEKGDIGVVEESTKIMMNILMKLKIGKDMCANTELMLTIARITTRWL